MKTESHSILMLSLGLVLLAGCASSRSQGVVGIPPELYSSRHAFGSREGALEAFGRPDARAVAKASPKTGKMLEDMTPQEQEELMEFYRSLEPETQAQVREDPPKAVRYYYRNLNRPLTLGDLPPPEQQEFLERYQNLPPETQQELQQHPEEHIR